MKKKKLILITGISGMIGRELKILFSKNKNIRIREADLKLGNDLRNFEECIGLCKNVDEVYHLAGIKGSPKKTSERPADFLVPMLQFNTNMLEAARLCKVKKFLYTSSIAVEHPETDEFPALAKLAGEKQIEAYRIQYKKNEIPEFCVVRPANVYGFDDFESKDAMVITSLIAKAFLNDKIEVWGDGSQIRDFVHARDVAKGMIQCIKKMPKIPINLCSGIGITIKEIVEIIAKKMDKEIQYDISQPIGAKSRVMKSNADLINWKPKIKIKDGIEEIIDYLILKIGDKLNDRSKRN